MIFDRRTLLAAVSGLVMTRPAAAQAGIPFEHAGGKVFVPARVNGQPIQAMLDSGSAFLGVDDDFAARAGIAATGRGITVRGIQRRLRGRLGKIATLAVGSVTLRDVESLVLDYSTLTPTVGRPVDMALGAGFLAGVVADLDFATRTVAFSPRAGFQPPAGLTELALTPRGGLMTVQLMLPRGPVMALVDTGSEPPLILSPGPADSAGLFRGKVSSAPLGGIGGGTVVRIASAPSVALGQLAFADVPVQSPPGGIGFPANLGLGLLSRFRLVLDFGGRRMWIGPGGETGPFKRDLLGFYGVVEGQRIRVTHVAKDSPAEAAGFRSGEVVTAINGRPAGEANQAFRDAAEGVTLTFTLADGKTRTVTLARYY